MEEDQSSKPHMEEDLQWLERPEPRALGQGAGEEWARAL